MTYDDSDGILCRPGGPRHPSTPGPYCLARCYCPGSPDAVSRGEARTDRSVHEWRRDAWLALRTLAESGESFTAIDLLHKSGGAPGTIPLCEALLYAAQDQRRIRSQPGGAWVGAAPVKAAPQPVAEGWPAALAGTEQAATRWTDEQRDMVLQALHKVCREQPTFTADAIWQVLGGAVPVTKGLTGVLVRGKNLGWCVQTDTTTIARRGGAHDHAQRLMVWRSLLLPAGS